jgi:hypothetical protein
MLFKQIMYGHLLGMIIVPVVISTDPRSGQEKRWNKIIAATFRCTYGSLQH